MAHYHAIITLFILIDHLNLTYATHWVTCLTLDAMLFVRPPKDTVCMFGFSIHMNARYCVL